MTSIAAVFGVSLDRGEASPTRRMLAAMRARGGDVIDDVMQPDDGVPIAALGAAHHAWESTARRAFPSVLQRGPFVVAADATLYYANDLRRTLRAGDIDRTLDTVGDNPPTETVGAGLAASLILAAYETYGDACVEHLEGDFAFILWDGRNRRVFAARDFAGRRTLFHAQPQGHLYLASTIRGLHADPRVARDVNLTTVASLAAGMWTHSSETSYRGVAELRAGHTLTWSHGHGATTRPFWRPPETVHHRRRPLDEGAAELRELIMRATDARMAVDGPTAISLSGGWDSPSVYAAGNAVLRESLKSPDAPNGASVRSLHPVSISYPVGDPGREDELIRDIVGHWQGGTRWLDVGAIPMFADACGAAACRDQPMAHTYEGWNRALFRGARAEGARVMLDGLGGDQLFQVSDIVLAHLFRGGRWVELARQYRARSEGSGNLRDVYRRAVRPALPAWLANAISAVRRTPAPRHYLDRQPPFWFNGKFLREHGVLDVEAATRPPLPTADFVVAESHAFLRFPFYPRITGMLYGFGLEEGVEVRSPLFDERVVRFALERPWSERADGRETKVLLRHAMRDLLPGNVLAPRAHRTGVTSAYFLRQMRGPARPLMEGVLQRSVLASLGMIDLRRLRRAWEHLLTHDDDELGGRIFFTLQAELWMRAREES